ncbi:hypothetical protein V8F33_014008 [Rhypophila sp. PSN 637]
MDGGDPRAEETHEKTHAEPVSNELATPGREPSEAVAVVAEPQSIIEETPPPTPEDPTVVAAGENPPQQAVKGQESKHRCPSVEDAVPRPKSIRGSIVGIFGHIILWLGTAAWASALGFLGFLWTSADRAMGGTPLPEAWVTIIAAGWLPQSITLLSLVFRVAITIQGGHMTSMIAAWVTERYLPSLYRGPTISMMRASTTSKPTGLAWSLLSDPIHRLRRTFIPFLLISATWLIVTASNLASTILLSDLGPGWYAEPVKSLPITLLSYASEQGTMEMGILNSSPDHPLIKDTGVTMRALPPFLATQRTTLHHFAGQAFLVDSRVMCINPGKSLEIQVTRHVIVGDFLYVAGTLSPEEIYNGPLELPVRRSNASFTTDLSYSFNCTAMVEAVSWKRAEGHRSWQKTACKLRKLGTNLVTNLDLSGINFSNLDPPNQDKDIGPDLNFLLLNVIGGYGNDDPFTLASDDHEWRRFTKSNGDSISITLCMATFMSSGGVVTMRRGKDSGAGIVEEPAFTRWTSSRERFDTSRVREFYGAVGADRDLNRQPDARGILTLQNTNNNNNHININNTVGSKWAHSEGFLGDLDRAFSNFQSGVFSNCNSPDNISANGTMSVLLYSHRLTALNRLSNFQVVPLHHSLVYIVQDILETTNNPAIALQTLLTIIIQRYYYEVLGVVDGYPDTEAQVGFTPVTTIPVRWAGYTAVCAIAGAHLLLLCITTIMFTFTTKKSKLGDFWSTFAQTCYDTNESVRTVLEEVKDVTDDNVKKWVLLKAKDRDEAVFRRKGRGGDT